MSAVWSYLFQTPPFLTIIYDWLSNESVCYWLMSDAMPRNYQALTVRISIFLEKGKKLDEHLLNCITCTNVYKHTHVITTIGKNPIKLLLGNPAVRACCVSILYTKLCTVIHIRLTRDETWVQLRKLNWPIMTKVYKCYSSDETRYRVYSCWKLQISFAFSDLGISIGSYGTEIHWYKHNESDCLFNSFSSKIILFINRWPWPFKLKRK